MLCALLCVCVCVFCCVWELFKSHEKVHALKHTSLAGLSGAWALRPHLAKDNIIHRCIANDKMERNSKMLMPLFGGRYDIYRPFFGNCLIVLTNIHMIDYSFLIHKFENYIFRTSKGLGEKSKPCAAVVTSPSREDTRVVTESSGRGFREGLINLTTANPATLNFLVTIFTAAHCGTQAGGFARRRFFPPRVGKFHFPRQFFPSRGLFNSCKRHPRVRDLLLQLGRASSACSSSRTSARTQLTWLCFTSARIVSLQCACIVSLNVYA